MNRRSFLSMLGMASAVATNASLLGALLKTETDLTNLATIPIQKQDDLVGGWVSYKVKYTMTLPPQYRLRNVELPRAQVIDGHNIVRRPYVRGQQVELV